MSNSSHPSATENKHRDWLKMRGVKNNWTSYYFKILIKVQNVCKSYNFALESHKLYQKRPDNTFLNIICRMLKQQCNVSIFDSGHNKQNLIDTRLT